MSTKQLPTTKMKASTVPTFSFPLGEEQEQKESAHMYGIPSIETMAHDHNVNQKLITVTEDKAFICLDKHLKKIGKKRWIHPLSLLTTLLLALATSEFDKLSWISADLLKATFVVSSFVTTGWLIYELMKSGRLKHLAEIIDDIFDELRGVDRLEPQPEYLTVQ